MNDSKKPKQGYKLVKSLFRKEIEIPEDWDFKRLGNLGEPVIGLTYEPKDVKSDGILVLRAPNIQDSRLRFEDNVFVDVKIKDKLKIKKGDLLICVRNGSKRLIGKCAYIDDNYKDMTFGAFMSVFRSPYNKFLFQQFQTPLIRKQITKSTTFTINQITNQNLNSFLVLMPPLEEQKKIAIILSSLDDLIKNYDSVIDSTVKLKKGLMQQLLTKGIGHTKFKKIKWYYDKEKEIPEKWDIVKLKNLLIRGNQGVNTAIDKVEYVNDGIPIIKAGNIREKFELTKTDKISKHSFDAIPEHHKPKKNDILYANIGSALGTAMLVNFDINTTIAWNVFLMKVKENINSNFLVYFLNQYEIWSRLKSMATQSTMPFISKPTLLSLDVLLPAFPEQQKITSILSEIDSKISDLESKKISLEQLKKGLMQKLLTGQIRVKV